MPKKDEELWKAFQKMEKCPQNNYFMARCKFCDPRGENLLQGRVRTLKNHLKKCQELSNAEEEDEKASEFTSVSQQSLKRNCESASSRVSIVSGSDVLTSKKLKTHSIKTFLDRDLTLYEAKNMLQRMIEMVADSGLSFQWIERPATIRFIEALRPSAAKLLPTRRVLGGRILREAACRNRDEQLPKIKRLVENDGCNVNFICDGWEDGSKRHILGCIVQVLNEWMSYDEALGNGNIIESDEHHGIATARLIETAFTKVINDLGMPVSCVVTDDAGQCQRAKRILSLRFPHMYFGKCYAHQVNLIVKDVFKLIYVQLVSRVKSLTKAYNKSASKWLVRLADRCKKLYGHSTSLLRIIDVRWNSVQSAFASLLRIRTALKLIHAEYGNMHDFPEDLKVDDAFFEQLVEAELLLRPLTKASFVMQRDCNTLADVLNMFGLLYQSFEKSHHANELQRLIEKRWNQQEQPLFLIAFMFHPKYANIFRGMVRFESKLDLGKVLQYCVLYYKKYIGNLAEGETNKFSEEVNDWYRDAVPEAQFLKSLSPIHFWIALKRSCPYSSRLAIFVLSIVVQTATCERLFSTFGNFATKKRNKLHSEKVHNLAQVKRAVAVMDEKTYNNRSITQIRILSSTELPRIDTEEQNVDAGVDEDNEVIQLSDMELEGDSDREDDTAEDSIIVEDWDTVFHELDRIDEEEYIESLYVIDKAVTHQMMTEVLQSQYSEGAQHRESHPYPNYNDTSYPQERLKGIRRVKFLLENLFPLSIEALDDFNVLE